MHDLFYYVIPLMNYGDKLVANFDKVYGMKIYDDVKVRFTKDGYVSVSHDKRGAILYQISLRWMVSKSVPMGRQ